MSTSFVDVGSRAVAVEADLGVDVSVVNEGSTVYYGKTAKVSPTQNDGSLVDGARLDVDVAAAGLGRLFFVSAATSRLVVTQTPRSPASLPGVWLPPDWGTFWKPKRDAGPSTLAQIALVGDSVARGYFASNLNTKGWAALVAAALQASYGDGGSGFQGIVDTDIGMTAIGVNATARTAYAAQKVLATGTWTYGADGTSVGASLLWTTTPASTLTFTVRGSSVTLFYQKATNGATGVGWTIDGNAQAALNMAAGSTQNASVTVTGLSPGVHTVVVTAPAGANVTTVQGCAGMNAAGVVLHNYSRYGSGSAAWGLGSADWSGGSSNPCDLLVHAVGVNDAGSGASSETWLQNTDNFLRRVRNVAAPQTDILLLLNHIGTTDSGPQYGLMAAKARGLAEAYGAAFLDLWALGRNSWAWWNALGYWSDASGTGAAGSDTVHPSDAGHAYLAGQVLPVLAAP